MYIFWFLHQTTTPNLLKWCLPSCISFDSYIKPQQLKSARDYFEVVYLLIPTSNHNLLKARDFETLLYIFWFLHQTTTSIVPFHNLTSCISFDSYIKPQLLMVFYLIHRVVYLLIPTSNHNLQIWTYWFSAHNKHSI